MGIKGLMKLIRDNAPESIKECEVKNFMGRIIAVDASMQLYQFMSMVRSQQQAGAQLLSNDAGDVTSHILGFFHRTIGLMEKGIKPIYVFDGKPPELKKHELDIRKEKKQKAEAEIKQLEIQVKEGNEEAKELLLKAQKKTIKVTKKHNKEVQDLLEKMGLPFLIAPSEAEAQCALLCKEGLVYATATEDMDALTFGTPKLLRNLTYSPSRKLQVFEIDLEVLLEQLKLSLTEFVDLCILCGCDYSPSIKGIGPKNGYKLISEHRTLEKVFKKLDRAKYNIPQVLEENVDEIRSMFLTPELLTKENIPKFVFKQPDEEGIIQYLVNEKQFALDRVKSALKRLKKTKNQTNQRRMDSFFKPAAKRNIIEPKQSKKKRLKKKK